VYAKATELVHKLEEGSPMLYIVQEMRQYLRDMSRYDTSLRDYLSAVQAALPSTQDVADTYVEILLAPIAVIDSVGTAAFRAATVSLSTVAVNLADATVESVRTSFAEERNLAYLGAGIAALGLIWSLRQ